MNKDIRLVKSYADPDGRQYVFKEQAYIAIIYKMPMGWSVYLTSTLALGSPTLFFNTYDGAIEGIKKEIFINSL